MRELGDLHAPCHACGAHIGRCYNTCQDMRACAGGISPKNALHATCTIARRVLSNCREACHGRALALAPACHCVPGGTILAGAIVPAECATIVHVGCSPLHTKAVPHMHAVPKVGKPLPTECSCLV